MQDCELLDLAGRPEHLLMTTLPVPPVCIRPRCSTMLYFSAEHSPHCFKNCPHCPPPASLSHRCRRTALHRTAAARSVEMDAGATGGSNEDDITMKLVQIVEVNNILRQVRCGAVRCGAELR